VNVQTGKDTAQHCESRKQLSVLKGPDQTAAHQIVHRQLGDIVAFEQHTTGGRRQHATDQVEQRGLSRAVGSDQASDFTLLDGQ